MSFSMTLLWISIVVVGITGALGVYIGMALLERLRKRYQELKQETMAIHHCVKQTQQKVEQMERQIGQVKQHLLLEHLGSMANQAKDAHYLDDSSFKKALELIHELEMDNLSGKDVQVPKELNK